MSEGLGVFEMKLDTWGRWGQHIVQHPLFLVNDKLLTTEKALEIGLLEEENQDHHSNKNLHYNRVYRLRSQVDAIIVFRCEASSRKHESSVEVVFGNVDVRKVSEPKGYVINNVWFISECQCVETPVIKSYNDVKTKWEMKKKLQELEEQKRAEEERRKKTSPKISVNVVDGKIVISGETFYIRDVIKTVALSLGSKAIFDGLKKTWIINNVDKNMFIDELKKLIPGVVVE